MDDSELGAAIRQLALSWHEWSAETERAERAAQLAEVVDGSRVVDGGQVDSDGAWEVTDPDTGDVIASGMGIESYEAAWRPEWVHRDSLSFDADEAVPRPDAPAGLPEELVQVLRDWALDNPGEVRTLLAN